LSYAKKMRLDGECMTVQLASKPTPGTTFMRVMIITIFSTRNMTISVSVIQRLRS
jgi:hypothetical protein